MANPLQSLLPKDPQGPGMGKELGEKMTQVNNARQALNPGSEAPKMSPTGAPAHMTPAQGPYGSQGSEKRIDVTNYQKPLASQMPKMHDGGTVTHTGPHVLKAGEKVLTKEQHGHITNALSLAQTALSHEPEQDVKPPKVVKDMRIRRSANGGHIVTHVHTHFEHPDEEHTTEGADGLVNHVLHHMTDPDDEETEADQGKAVVPESKGTAAAEEAVGFKK